MRNSAILKWGNNNKNNKLSLSLGNGGSTSKNADKSGNSKNWIHSPDTLLNGHVVYLVKFLGDIEVDKPKGIDVVKQGVQKLKFNQQLKKAESGSSNMKMPKAELTISVNGVTIMEPKTQKQLHQYPLHRISYCADDKAEKRFFSFIAKDPDSSKHTCFVFLSDKLAEEITLTIGQAFELAYKKFLDSKGKDLETQKQTLILQKRISILENETKELKKRLLAVASIKSDADVKEYMRENNICDLCSVDPIVDPNSIPSTTPPNGQVSADGHEPSALDVCQETSLEKSSELICLDDSSSSQVDFGGITLDNFTLEEMNDDDFDPRAPESIQSSVLAVLPPPPPALPPREFEKKSPLPAAENNNNPFVSPSESNLYKNSNDPFGMASFTSSSPAIVKPSSDPLASLNDLDPFKNL